MITQKTRKNMVFLLTTIMLISLFPAISAQISFCCEKTTYGAWCQNEVQESCDSNFKISPTACDSTSYCKRGCCFDSQEGLCNENTPERVCQDSGGTWNEEASCNIPQCQLGCCLLGGQAALTTMTRCSSLAGFYGVLVDFRSDIVDEIECIATANALDKGACVFEDSATASKTCKFTTRGECNEEFHKDVLCSAEELATVCAPSTKTTLIDGRDEIYYLDTCGNPANIYDASRFEDDMYWTKVFTKAESCGASESNAGSESCGNCNYFLGSMPKEAGLFGQPTYGDYICVDLACDNGRQHGESWCAQDPDAGENDRVGSRYFKQICVNGEVLTEPCADFRNEICVETPTGSFTESICVANRWQDCVSIEDQDDCESLDVRDCKWIEGYFFGSDGTSSMVSYSVENKKGKKITASGLCVPQYAPGFLFWGKQNSAVTKEKTFQAETPEFQGGAQGGIIGKAIAKITGRQVDEGEGQDTSDTDTQEEATVGSGEAFENPSEKKAFENPSAKAFGTGNVNPRASVSPTDSCAMADATFQINFKRYKRGADFGGKTDWECTGEALTGQHNDPRGKELCNYFTKDKLTNPEGFADQMNAICTAIGDCGEKPNWAGKSNQEGFAVYWRGERVAGTGGSEVLEEEEEDKSKTTGSVIKELIKNLGGKSE